MQDHLVSNIYLSMIYGVNFEQMANSADTGFGLGSCDLANINASLRSISTSVEFGVQRASISVSRK